MLKGRTIKPKSDLWNHCCVVRLNLNTRRVLRKSPKNISIVKAMHVVPVGDKVPLLTLNKVNTLRASPQSLS